MTLFARRPDDQFEANGAEDAKHEEPVHCAQIHLKPWAITASSEA